LYRKGVSTIEEMSARTSEQIGRLANRMEELADESDKHNVLLASLMESQMRTEEGLRKTDEALRKTDEGLRRLEETVSKLAESVQRLVDRNGDKPAQ
jgi:methyl-accepting chemotaxis protein